MDQIFIHSWMYLSKEDSIDSFLDFVLWKALQID